MNRNHLAAVHELNDDFSLSTMNFGRLEDSNSEISLLELENPVRATPDSAALEGAEWIPFLRMNEVPSMKN
jgi:hypothetical protein